MTEVFKLVPQVFRKPKRVRFVCTGRGLSNGSEEREEGDKDLNFM